MVARSYIREEQVIDSDFLSEREFTIASGVIYDQITTLEGELRFSIDTKTFIDLLDTPASYNNNSKKLLIVNESEDGLYFSDVIDCGTFI